MGHQSFKSKKIIVTGNVKQHWQVEKERKKEYLFFIGAIASIIISIIYFIYCLNKIDNIINHFSISVFFISLFYLLVGSVLLSPLIRFVLKKLALRPFKWHRGDNYNIIRTKRMLCYMGLGLLIFIFCYVFIIFL
jgi:hypothetical protein